MWLQQQQLQLQSDFLIWVRLWCTVLDLNLSNCITFTELLGYSMQSVNKRYRWVIVHTILIVVLGNVPMIDLMPTCAQ